MILVYTFKVFNIVAMFSIILLLVTGCEKFVQVEAPQTSVNEENVYKTDATAIAVLTGVYSQMVNDGLFTGRNSISVLSGLSADEFTLAGVVSDNKFIAYYRNQLRANLDENYGTDVWRIAYFYIFSCNAAIEGLGNSQSLTVSVKNQLRGEAKFLRAFFYFYLVNLYGDVPLALSTNASVNAALLRSPKQKVYEQIVADLKEAQQLLSDYYLNRDLQTGTTNRVRPTKWAATALLARTYLYMTEYANAEAEASKVINNTQFSLSPLSAVFLKNSMEVIWQLQPVQSGRNTEDAMTFILPSTGPNANVNPVFLSTQVLNAFEAGDWRRKAGGWVDSVKIGSSTYFYPAKYKATTTSGSFTEYLMMFRLAEQYLIRAEARAQQNNIGEAQNDLNMIRTRAGLVNTSASNKESLLSGILQERQVELFSEHGHRWLDIKRTGNVDAVMSLATPLKAGGTPWQSYQQLYPVYFSDIEKNPKLNQNLGY